jgi:hypothetical protein
MNKIKKALVACFAAMATLFILSPAAFAEADAQTITEVGAEITASAFIVTLIISYIIPLITAFVTKLGASVTVKQFVTAILAAINGFLTTSLTTDGSAVFTTSGLLFAILSFITAQIAYVSSYRPRNLNSKAAPEFGIG